MGCTVKVEHSIITLMKLILLSLVAVIVVGYTAFTLLNPSASRNIFAGNPQKIETVQGSAIRQAKEIYAEKKEQKIDFSQSPCLSEDMGNGYALDIVHNPRQIIDDQNLCLGFMQGTVTHQVELTPDGNVLRVH